MNNNMVDEAIRQKINTVQELPGITFDKEAAWRKMEQKRERKPVVMLWLRYSIAAAAALLLCWMLIVLIAPRNSIQIAQHNKKLAPILRAGPPLLNSVSHAPANLVETKVSENRVFIKHNTTHAEELPLERDKYIANENTKHIVLPISTPVNNVSNENIPAATNDVAAIKKKPVIHINEVYYQPDPINIQEPERFAPGIRLAANAKGYDASSWGAVITIHN